MPGRVQYPRILSPPRRVPGELPEEVNGLDTHVPLDFYFFIAVSFQMPLADARAQWGRVASIPVRRAVGQQPAWKGQCRECLLGDTGTACPEWV